MAANPAIESHGAFRVAYLGATKINSSFKRRGVDDKELPAAGR